MIYHIASSIFSDQIVLISTIPDDSSNIRETYVILTKYKACISQVGIYRDSPVYLLMIDES